MDKNSIVVEMIKKSQNDPHFKKSIMEAAADT